jgi:hypothetical protein
MVLVAPDELADRLAQTQTFLENHPEHGVPGWMVYALIPVAVEFWQGCNRPSAQKSAIAIAGKWPWLGQATSLAMILLSC